MQAKQEKESRNKIFQLPEIETKHSSKLISKIVTITFGIILLVVLIALIVISVVRMDVSIDAEGQLEPAEITAFHSKIKGEVKEIFVKSGSQFHRGDLLVQFDSVKLYDQYEKLQSDLSKLNIEYEIKSRSIPLEQAQNELQRKKAEAQLLKAKANIRQKLNDFFPGANADSLLVNYKKGTHVTMDYAIAEMISAEAELEGLDSRESTVQLKELELKSMLFDFGQLKTAINRQREYLERTKLRAPYDGIVITGNLQKLEGQFVNEGAKLFEISKPGNWRAILNANENDVYDLNVGDSVKIEVKAMKLAEEFIIIPGKIVSISEEPQKDQLNQISGGFYKVEVSVTATDEDKFVERFKRGFTIDAKIIKDSDRIINILIKNLKKLL